MNNKQNWRKMQQSVVLGCAEVLSDSVDFFVADMLDVGQKFDWSNWSSLTWMEFYLVSSKR